jgi:16S rRNA (uracil1498-N3)-methyltransferase
VTAGPPLAWPPLPRFAALAVGPEGGWTPSEIEQLLEAGAAPVTLGGRTLRAETATIVGLTLLQHGYGDLRGK